MDYKLILKFCLWQVWPAWKDGLVRAQTSPVALLTRPGLVCFSGACGIIDNFLTFKALLIFKDSGELKEHVWPFCSFALVQSPHWRAVAGGEVKP